MTHQPTQDIDAGAIDLTPQTLDPTDTLTGCSDITWTSSLTTARTEHVRGGRPTVPANVTHTAHFAVTPMALPTVQLEYGTVKFWPLAVSVTWTNGELDRIDVKGQQATKAGLGKDERERSFRIAWRKDTFDRSRIPAKLRAVIDRYEVKVAVTSPSPVVVE